MNHNTFWKAIHSLEQKIRIDEVSLLGKLHFAIKSIIFLLKFKGFSKTLTFVLKKIIQSLGLNLHVPPVLPKNSALLQKFQTQILEEGLDREISNVELISIIKNSANFLIIQRGIEWHERLKQRTHHIAKYWAKSGGHVLFLSPGGFKDIPGNWITKNQRIIHTDKNINWKKIKYNSKPIIYNWGATLNTSFKVSSENFLFWYDIIDDDDIFQMNYKNRVTFIKLHKEECARANYITYSAKTLKNLIPNNFHLKSHFVPNGVEFDKFNKKNIILENLKFLNPIYGFHGAIARWIDLEWLANLAINTKGTLVLIGPVLDCDEKIWKKLIALKNVNYLGSRPYILMPSLVQQFDFGLLPFKINSITNATFPLKLFEYLAADIPVIATPTEELKSLKVKGLIISSNSGNLDNYKYNRPDHKFCKPYSWENIFSELNWWP